MHPQPRRLPHWLTVYILNHSYLYIICLFNFLVDSDELNFQNPTSLSGPLTIGQPKMLMAQLKEYQLKGLNWLGTLYEQGINGILADEMGLGKVCLLLGYHDVIELSVRQTVQSISLLAYLAETHDIWGPFLVVAPASTLHNWQQELTRFVPNLKALPYWGNVKDRATLRKFWSKKEISYNQDAPFHVLITSYQLVSKINYLWKVFEPTLLPDYPRSAILSTCQMAIYDFRRGPEHQKFV